jgi:Domain of unknown function (DUF4328)
VPCSTCGRFVYVPVCPNCGTPADAPTDVQIAPPPSPAIGPWPGVPARAVRGVGYAAMAAVALSMLVHLVLRSGLVFLAHLAWRSADTVSQYMRIMDAFSTAERVTVLVTATLVIVWLYRARKNLDAFGLPATMRAGWAIGGWFVPFANLVIPCRVMLDVARKSSIHPAGALVGVWWVAWLGSYVVNYLAVIAAVQWHGFMDNTYAEMLMVQLLPGAFLEILAGLVLITLISRISRAQTALISQGAAPRERTAVA